MCLRTGTMAGIYAKTRMLRAEPGNSLPEPDNDEGAIMEEQRRSIADDERSPASEAADAVPFGPSGTNAEDEQRQEPQGTSEATEPKTDSEGNPIVPPSRQTH